MVNAQDGGQDWMDDLDVMWKFDLPSYLKGCAQDSPAAGDSDDETE